jgi:hypothetical protein
MYWGAAPLAFPKVRVFVRFMNHSPMTYKGETTVWP